LFAYACVLLVVSAAMVPFISRLTPRSTTGGKTVADEPIGKGGGFAMIRADRYLMLIAMFTLLLNVVNTNGEYLFGRYIVEQSLSLHPGTTADALAARERFVGETYSQFSFYVNLAGFLLQMFVVSRMFKWLGIARSLLVHPVVALLGYLLMLRAPSLQMISLVKVTDNSINYSLSNTTRQALWLPTSREAKYKAKQAVDSFVVRAGDVASAGVVFLDSRLMLTVSAFAGVQVGLVAAWLGVVGMLTIAQARRAPAVAPRPESA